MNAPKPHYERDHLPAGWCACEACNTERTSLAMERAHQARVEQLVRTPREPRARIWLTDPARPTRRITVVELVLVVAVLALVVAYTLLPVLAP